MSALQRILVGVGFAKGTGKCRPCKVLVGDDFSGAHRVTSLGPHGPSEAM